MAPKRAAAATAGPSTAAAAKDVRPPRTRAPFENRRALFKPEIEDMMYAFGDVKVPLDRTVDAMEDILTEYLTDVFHTAHSVSTNRGKLKVDDLRFALRSERRRKQLARLDEILVRDKYIKAVRQVEGTTMTDMAKLGKEAEKTQKRAAKKIVKNDKKREEREAKARAQQAVLAARRSRP